MALFAQLYEDPKVHDALMRDVPIRRLGKPSDMAAAAAFLCSDDAAYITGPSAAPERMGLMDIYLLFSLFFSLSLSLLAPCLCLTRCWLLTVPCPYTGENLVAAGGMAAHL